MKFAETDQPATGRHGSVYSGPSTAYREAMASRVAPVYGLMLCSVHESDFNGFFMAFSKLSPYFLRPQAGDLIGVS